MSYDLKYFLSLLFSLFVIFNISAQDVQISGSDSFNGEPFLSINPSNSQHIVVAWMGYVPFNAITIKTKVSFDCGTTWSDETVIPHEFPGLGTTSADPSIAFDNLGNVILCFVDYNVLAETGAVFIRKSLDGGLNWQEPVEVINLDADAPNKPADRPWMKIDRSSGVNNGNIYVTTMSPAVFGNIPPPFHPYVTRSTDGGNSFDPWQYLDADNWLAGSFLAQPSPFPTITQNGTLHVVYPSIVFTQNANFQYLMATSTDGGNNYTHSAITAQPTDSLVLDQDAKKGFPLVADPSDNDHLVFLSVLNIHEDADVYMWETYDGGLNWIDPIRINDDPIGNDRMQDLIWADFDEEGDLIVTWRDRRNGQDATYAAASEIWGAVRDVDSLDFSPNFMLSDTIAPFDSVLYNGGNDFMCVDLVNDTIHAVWGDTRDGSLSIWFKKISVDGTIVSVSEIAKEGLPQVNVYPNPSISSVIVQGRGIDKLVLISEKGEIIRQQEISNGQDNTLLDISELHAGIYIVRIVTDKGVVNKKIVKQNP